MNMKLWESPSQNAEVHYEVDYSDYTVNFDIDEQWFDAKDLRALANQLITVAEKLDAKPEAPKEVGNDTFII